MAIALKDWSQFDLLKEHLLGTHFIKGKPKQRFYYKGADGTNDYEIDIVPFGELEADEKVAWPPEGNPEMSVKCFKDVMGIADTVTIDDAITIRISPLSGQFLIKFDTWLDRHLSARIPDFREMCGQGTLPHPLYEILPSYFLQGRY